MVPVTVADARRAGLLITVEHGEFEIPCRRRAVVDHGAAMRSAPASSWG
jgi:hypothetical protein